MDRTFDPGDRVFNATVVWDDLTCHYASPDGELWMGVRHPVEDDQRQELIDVMNGTGTNHVPICATRAWVAGFAHRPNATVTFHD